MAWIKYEAKRRGSGRGDAKIRLGFYHNATSNSYQCIISMNERAINKVIQKNISADVFIDQDNGSIAITKGKDRSVNRNKHGTAYISLSGHELKELMRLTPTLEADYTTGKVLGQDALIIAIPDEMLVKHKPTDNKASLPQPYKSAGKGNGKAAHI